VPGVRFGMLSVLSVRNGIVDGLERYHMYRMGLWIGAQSSVLLMIFSIIEARI
jgi:hypothetical protein